MPRLFFGAFIAPLLSAPARNVPHPIRFRTGE